MQQSHALSDVSINPQCHSDLTIGVDLGDRWSRYCVLDQAGTVIEEDRVRTNETSLRLRFTRTAARVVQSCFFVIVVMQRLSTISSPVAGQNAVDVLNRVETCGSICGSTAHEIRPLF